MEEGIRDSVFVGHFHNDSLFGSAAVLFAYGHAFPLRTRVESALESANNSQVDSASLAEVHDNALLTENPQRKEEDVGGIDLDPNKLNLQTQGKGINFNSNFGSDHLEEFPINGYSPFIFKITPVSGLLLGLTDDHSEQLSAIRR